MAFWSGLLDGVGDFFTGNWGDLGEDISSMFGGEGEGSLPGWLANSASTLASGAFGYAGQSGANEMNLQIAREQSSFNSAEAQKNRDFQYGVSGTAHQRAVADLTAAGLNPMLAYANQASSPGGSMASASPSHPMQSPAIAGLQGAQQGAMLQEQVKNLQAQTERTKTETSLLSAQAGKTVMDTNLSVSSASHMDAMVRQIEANMRLIEPQYEKLRAEYHKIDAEADKERFYVEELQPLEKLMKLMEAQLTDLELPGATNRSSAEGTWWKKNVAPFLGDAEKIGRGVGSAAGGVGVGRILGKGVTVNKGPTNIYRRP